MIRIEKPEAPEILTTRGSQKTRQDCNAYDSGSMEFDFERGIYASKKVTDCLREAQHGKCCYCESKFEGTSYAQVEHFRPKASVRQAKEADREHPGYYWLAYEWSNLFVSCRKCNTSKSDLFPLADARRARSHRDDTEDERALLVDPGREDPRVHIRFRESTVIYRTVVGKKSIEVLKLRRDPLDDDRERQLDKFRSHCSIVELEEDHSELTAIAEEMKVQILAAMQADSEFSSMFRDFIDRAGIALDKPGTGHCGAS